MPALLLKLIPFRDYVYAGIAIVATIFCVHEYHVIEAKGAAHETAAVMAASAKTTAAAKVANDKLTADYSTAVVNIGKTYAKAMQDSDAAHAADTQRLRILATSHSGANTSVDSTASTSASTDTGASGAVALGVVPADRALDLASALRADDAALTQCYADRDSLTGK